MTDHDLRRWLISYREATIYARPADAKRRKHGLLRRAMIDHLVEWKPTSTGEWYRSLPDRLRDQTDWGQFPEHGPAVIALVNRHLQIRRVKVPVRG